MALTISFSTCSVVWLVLKDDQMYWVHLINAIHKCLLATYTSQALLQVPRFSNGYMEVSILMELNNLVTDTSKA